MYRDRASAPARGLLLDGTYRYFDDNVPDAARELRDGATQFVPGDGSLNPKLLVIGEAPGAQEDAKGSPFVGKSGRLLDQLLLLAGLFREEVWITNVVKYRPPGNRTPDPDEVEAFLPLLRREVALVAGDATRFAVGLGSTACRALTGESISVAKSHGSWVDLKAGWKLFVSYHPAAGLRSVTVRAEMRIDFVKLGRLLGTNDKGRENFGGPGNYRGRQDRFN